MAFSARVGLSANRNGPWPFLSLNFVCIWTLSLVKSICGSIGRIHVGRFGHRRFSLVLIWQFGVFSLNFCFLIVRIFGTLFRLLFTHDGSLWNQIWRVIYERMILGENSSDLFKLFLILDKHSVRVLVDLNWLIRLFRKNTATFLRKLPINMIWTQFRKFVTRSWIFSILNFLFILWIILHSTDTNNIMLFIEIDNKEIVFLFVSTL